MKKFWVVTPLQAKTHGTGRKIHDKDEAIDEAKRRCHEHDQKEHVVLEAVALVRPKSPPVEVIDIPE